MYEYEPQVFEFDYDGDGYVDTYIEQLDTDNNGLADTAVIIQDTNMDGHPDVVVKAFDYNQDGQMDSVQTRVDTNGDGRFDFLEKDYDSTGDGMIDTVEVFHDLTGTGQPDTHEVYAFDPQTGQLEPTWAAADFDLGGTVYTELPMFDPAQVTDPDSISGDPASSIEHWEFQGSTNRCALYSQKFVIEELTGEDINIEEFAEVAKENGWFTEEGGTTFLNMNKMLNYYGIDNEMKFHGSIEDIENCLNKGGRVIVSIDSDEIWKGETHDIFAPESSADHAVEVVGIDRSDPSHPMVILNDSGTPHGKGEMVPLEVFEQSWEDGNNQIITCYPSSRY